MDKIKYKNRKISFYLSELDEGGAENAMVIIANELSKRGYEVDFVLAKARGAFITRLLPSIKIINLDISNKYLSLLKLINYFRDNPSVVMLSTLHVNNIMAILAKKISGTRNSRIVIRVATTVSAQRRVFWKKILEKVTLSAIYPFADTVVAVSNIVASDLENYINLPRRLIKVIYNPSITDELVAKSQEQVDHPWFKLASVPIVLGVGRLTIDKGYANLIKAISIVYKKKDVRLILLGDGDQRENLKNLAKRLEVDGIVDFKGFVENPFSYMRRSSVLVLPSLWEGLPNVLIEGLACGCQIVSTDSPGGVNEILDNGKYGFLVPVGDTKMLAERVLEVLDGAKLVVDPIWLDQFKAKPVIDLYVDALKAND